MSDLPPGVRVIPPQELPPGVRVLPPSSARAERPVSSWEQLKQAVSGAPQEGQEAPSLWDRLKQGVGAVARGNLVGLKGPSALEKNAEIAAQHPYRRGMTAGQMMGGDTGGMDNPMLGAFGPGNIARAGAAAPTAAASRLADFEGQGVTPSIPAIGQTKPTALAARVGSALPASPVGRGFERNVGEAAQAAEARAGELGTASADAGGSIAQNALKRFAADKTQTTQKYDEFWRLMHGAPNAPVTQTLRVLNDIHGRFPNAPELEGLFTNPKLDRMREAMTPRTVTTPGTTSPILNQYGMPSAVTPATTTQRGGALSIPELKELKTQVGYLLEKPPAEIPRSQLKALYGSLSNDLRGAAAQRSPAAARALAVADATFARRMTMMDQLSTLVDKDAPEPVFRALEMAAGEGAGARAGLLRTAKEAIGPKDWADVGASMVRRLGNPRPGMPRDPNVPDFSVDAFSTNWQKLSPKAKDVLFGPDNPGTPRAGLEQLGRVTADLRNLGRMSGHSGHFGPMQAAGVSSIITELITMMSMGRAPIKELAGLSGAYGVSKMLMMPWFAKMAYAPENAARDMVSRAGRAGVVDAAIQEAGRERSDRPVRHSVAGP